MQEVKEMILFIQCVVCCLLFTLAILPAQYKRMIKQRKKAHVVKKIFGLIFFVVNIYNLIVLDWGFVIVRS